MDFQREEIELISRELLVALRGRRSQRGWSQHLGYQSNVASRWESGKRWPQTAEFFRTCGRAGVDLRAALRRFLNRSPAWLDGVALDDPALVAALLVELRGNTPVQTLAARTGHSRFAISRWLSASTQPRLPDFLLLVEASSLRVVDLVTELVAPEKLPTVLPRWRKLEARRQGANSHPWTQAILRGLELGDYRALPAHRPGWLATRLGISVSEEALCISFLEETGQITWDGSHYQQGGLAVDTSRYPEIGRRLKLHWVEVAQERIREGAPGQFSYNVFTVSRADFERIRQAHLRYFHTVRSIIGSSEPAEVVAVANIHLFALEDAAR